MTLLWWDELQLQVSKICLLLTLLVSKDIYSRASKLTGDSDCWPTLPYDIFYKA